MTAAIQRILLAIAGFALRRGLLATAPGRALFETAYQAYKSVLEAPAIDSLHPFVGPGDWVIDVGANAGFFSRRFARWATDGGRVIAIEPAPDNIARLHANLARWRLGGRVDVVAAAATDTDGETTLALDPGNPADHRLSDKGETVKAVTLDQLVAGYGDPRIGLVKIDVQGAEPLVLAGAKALIARDRPILVIEVSEQIESVAGVPRAEMIHSLMADGYIARRLTRRGLGPVLDRDGLDRLTAEAWYYDLVLIAPGAEG